MGGQPDQQNGNGWMNDNGNGGQNGFGGRGHHGRGGFGEPDDNTGATQMQPKQGSSQQTTTPFSSGSGNAA